MSITLLAGGTCSVTGGANRALNQDGVKVTAGHHYTDEAPTDFRLRASLTLKNRQPTYVRSSGLWKKGRREAVIAFPQLLASGEYVFNAFRFISEIHPELAVADEIALRNEAAQIAFDSELTPFWQSGRTVF